MDSTVIAEIGVRPTAMEGRATECEPFDDIRRLDADLFEFLPVA